MPVCMNAYIHIYVLTYVHVNNQIHSYKIQLLIQITVISKYKTQPNMSTSIFFFIRICDTTKLLCKIDVLKVNFPALIASEPVENFH